MPIEIRGVIVDTYVQALRVVFLMTVGFVFLNTLSGALLKEHTLHDNLDRTPLPTSEVDGGEVDGETA